MVRPAIEFRFGNKPVLTHVLVLRLLERCAWQGVWVSSFGGVKFVRTMPADPSLRDARVDLPEEQARLHKAITARCRARGGCFDVFAWKGEHVLFCETKRRSRDALRATQIECRQQGTDDTTLRRSRCPRHDAAVLHLHRRLQPALDVEQHPWTIRMTTDCFASATPNRCCRRAFHVDVKAIASPCRTLIDAAPFRVFTASTNSPDWYSQCID